MKKLFVFFIMALILAAGGAGALFWNISEYAKTPGSGTLEKVHLTVKPGMPFSLLTERLADRGLIRSPLRFHILARLKGDDRRIKAGEYLLYPTMTPARILEILTQGRVRERSVTIPEGYTLHQIGAAMDDAEIVSKADFIGAATDPAFVKEKGISGATFEGYLFPSTYNFSITVHAAGVVSRMTDQFKTVFTPEWEARAKELGYTVHEIVTLASIIEKETGAAHERPVISSVFHNRLKKGMRLQSDPTVIYGIPNFNGNLTKKHLKTPTPYNTYQKAGFPIGPIANPGAAAIEAALYPAETKYLYFVSRKDGTHEFSTNLKDHNRAVRKYQLR